MAPPEQPRLRGTAQQQEPSYRPPCSCSAGLRPGFVARRAGETPALPALFDFRTTSAAAWLRASHDDQGLVVLLGGLADEILDGRGDLVAYHGRAAVDVLLEQRL